MKRVVTGVMFCKCVTAWFSCVGVNAEKRECCEAFTALAPADTVSPRFGVCNWGKLAPTPGSTLSNISLFGCNIPRIRGLSRP